MIGWLILVVWCSSKTEACQLRSCSEHWINQRMSLLWLGWRLDRLNWCLRLNDSSLFHRLWIFWCLIELKNIYAAICLCLLLWLWLRLRLRLWLCWGLYWCFICSSGCSCCWWLYLDFSWFFEGWSLFFECLWSRCILLLLLRLLLLLFLLLLFILAQVLLRVKTPSSVVFILV